MSIVRRLWSDERGSVLSAELVTVSTIAVVGVTAGLTTVTHSINEELLDVARAIRSLNQSYAVPGFRGCHSYTAGSCYTQQPVAKSLAELQLHSEVVPCPADTKAVAPGVQPSEKVTPKMEKRKKKKGKVDETELDETVSPADEKTAEPGPKA